MPRYLAAAIVMAFIASAPRSAQSDSTPSVTVDRAPNPAPTFHDGQWAGRFTMSGGFYGAGAMLFTSPSAAWTLDLGAGATHYDFSNSDNSVDQANVALSIGRRWYGAAHSRVRPLGGIGIAGDYSVNDQSNNSGARDKAYHAGVYGELGAAIFVAPELSLGATWRAAVSGGHDDNYELSHVNFSVGYMSLEGAFFF
jgi:hypothetical protein